MPGQLDRNANVPVGDSGEKKSEAVAEEPKQVAVAASGGGEKVVVAQQHPPQGRRYETGYNRSDSI